MKKLFALIPLLAFGFLLAFAPAAEAANASGSITTQNLNPSSGAATAGSTVALTGLAASDNLTVQVSGTYTGALSAQVSADGSNWVTAPIVLTFGTNIKGTNIPSASVGVFQVVAPDMPNMRVTALGAVTGTAVVTIYVIPAGATTTATISGTVPVAGTGTAGTPGTAVLAVQGVAGGTPQPISGTVISSGGTSNATSAVATSSTNVPSAAYNYAFNGTTWDQLQDDGSKNLKVTFGAIGVTAQTSAASSFPVALANEDVQDQYVTGQGAQTTLNNNIILASAGSGSFDTMIGTPAISYRSWSIEVVVTAGISGGQITFESSNDNTNFVSCTMWDNVAQSLVNQYTVVSSTSRIFEGPVRARYIRARISTGISGGSVQAFTRLTMTSSYLAVGGPTNLTSVDSNSIPTTPISGQSGILAVGLSDLPITGAGSQTALNNNIILASAGSTATAALGYRSWSIAIVPATGTVTAGNIAFEGSNDNANWFSMNMFDAAAATTSPVTSYAVVAATNRFFKGPLQWQFIRARISTGITGTTTGVQAFILLSQSIFVPDLVNNNLNSIQGTAVVAAGVNGVQAVGGKDATSGAPTANPINTGGVTLTSLPGAVLANGLVDYIRMTGDQQVIIHQDGDPANEWQATSGLSAFTSTASTALKAAGAAGVRNYVTGVQLVNDSTTATTVTLLDGAAVIWSIRLPANSASLQDMPVNVEFHTPLKGTAATAMNIQQSGAANLWYNVQGFQNN